MSDYVPTGQGPKPQPNESQYRSHLPEGSNVQSWQSHPAIRTQEEPRIPAEVETLRDRFAMAALSSIMLGADAGKIDDSELAAICYGLASAMMEARKK